MDDKEVLRMEAVESSSIELNTMNRYGTSGSESERGLADNIEMDKITEDSEDEVKNSNTDTPNDGTSKRQQWDNRFQFLLTLIGYAVGLGNVWRFSFYCAKNGGSAFLVPYLIMLFVLGIPLFYLELSLGQSVRRGPVRAWFKISPNLSGVGVSAVITSCYIIVYYNVIIAWVFYYLFNTFHAHLPWGNCFGYRLLALDEDQKMEILENYSRTDISSCFNASTEFYWYNNALGVSSDIGTVSSFNWKMFLCLALAWVVVYLCLFRGIESSGKVVYFTATFPYLVLICLFFRAVTLSGAGEGLRYLFLPSNGWSEHIFSPQVWLEAATQIFFSLGLSTGALIALSSYSKPRYNALANSVIVCLTNSFTSIFSSIIIFSIIGFRAAKTNTDPELVSRGPGLAFVIITEAVLNMAGSPLWGFLFFMMLLTLGLDSQFATVETVITVFYDIKSIKKIRKELFVGVLCVAFFIVSIPFVFGNGVYLFELFDQYAGSIPLLLIGFFEYIAIGWVFGIEKFFTVHANPYRRYLLKLWIVMYKWVGPIVMFIIFITSVTKEIINPLSYTVYRDYQESTEDEQPVYPSWAQFIGAVIILSIVLMIPIVLITRLIIYQSARDEAMEFILHMLESSKSALHSAKQVPTNIRRCIASTRRCIAERRWNYWYEREDNEVPYHNHYDEVGLSGSGGDTTD